MQRLVLGLAMLSMMFFPSATSQASHTGEYNPFFTTSWYMNTVDTTKLRSLGCSKGNADEAAPGTQYSTIIFAYGQPVYDTSKGYGASGFHSDIYFSTSEIAAAIEAYAKEYYACSGTDVSSTITIAVGTSNYPGRVAGHWYDHGVQWANMVDRITAYLTNNGYDSQVLVTGAIDAELKWNEPTDTRAWTDGYESANTRIYYDFGDANDCPPSSTSCYGAWTLGHVYYISWGEPSARAIPQIYATSGINAKQWQQISLWGPDHGQPPISFDGALTDRGEGLQDGFDTNKPYEGWCQLYHELNSDYRTVDRPKRSPDIRKYWETNVSVLDQRPCPTDVWRS